MTPYLLDTNILSYFLRDSHPGLYARMAGVLDRKEAVISAITRAEVRFGQSRMTLQDKRRRRIDLLLEQ